MIRCGPISLSIQGIEFDIQHAKNPLKFTHLQFKHLPGALGMGDALRIPGVPLTCASHDMMFSNEFPVIEINIII